VPCGAVVWWGGAVRCDAMETSINQHIVCNRADCVPHELSLTLDATFSCQPYSEANNITDAEFLSALLEWLVQARTGLRVCWGLVVCARACACECCVCVFVSAVCVHACVCVFVSAVCAHACVCVCGYVCALCFFLFGLCGRCRGGK
jgi:hypothetical protein